MAEPEPTEPSLTESARTLYEAARTVAGAWGGNVAALRRLLAADFALARAALIHGLVGLLAAAILFGTAWVLLTALSVWGLHKAGLGWEVAMGAPMLASVVLGGFAFRHARRVVKHAEMDASRRQLTLWFGTLDEKVEAKQAPAGTLHAGAQPNVAKTDGPP